MMVQMKLKCVTVRLLLASVILALATSCLYAQKDPAGMFNVKDFGAIGDGVTLNTSALQAAIDRCSISGGVVVFPPGRYQTGSLELRSNVEIQVQTGAIILGSPNIADYFERIPKLKSYSDSFLKHSLFFAEGQSNIAITGGGTIDGQGSNFKVLTKEKPARYKNRPYIIRFIECTDVTVRDVTLRNSASWMQHYLACERVTIHGIKVTNHANQNNDMIDIDGCRDVVISDCIGDTDDDGITLKSTSERVTENVTISNCIISSHCNAIKAGTESTGGFKNITINNMVIRPSSISTVKFGLPEGISGISLEVVDGGSMEGVSISNVVMDGPAVPIFVRLGNRGRKHWEGALQPGIGTMKSVALSHVTAHNVKSIGCSITGLPEHAAEGISLSDIRIRFAGGVRAMPKTDIDELADQYPEATMWGTLPSYGFYVRHVKGLRVKNLVMEFAQEDVRPAFFLSDVAASVIESLDAAISGGDGAALMLENVRGLSVTGASLRGKAHALFKLIGDKNAGIIATGNDLTTVDTVCEPEAALGVAVHASGNQLGH
jgi:polygalacturonase